MKRRSSLIGLAMLVPVQFASGAQSPCSPAPTTPTAAKSGSALAVSALMCDAYRYKGTIRVEGLVRKVFPKERKLGLIDATEFKKSGMISACCANQVLPVQWSGPMPEVKSVVLATGEIRKVRDKLEFVAMSLEKVPVK